MKLGKVFNSLTRTSTAANPAGWLMETLGVSQSKTGQRVTVESSLGLAPVMYAVNKVSGHISQMPIEVYRDNQDGTQSTIENNVYRLLNKKPNNIMTPFTLRETMMVHALICGNGRAYIERNSMGTPIGLIPIMPYNVQTIMVEGEKWHIVTRESGQAQDIIGRTRPVGKDNWWKVPDRDMLHIMNTSYNGIWGLHVIDIARDVFGLTQAGQDGAAVTIANSGRPGILLEAPPGMFRTPKDAKEWLDNFNSKHEGIENSGRAGLLTDGITASTLPISANDAQFLEQRGFQREEVALLFGLESILGDNSGQTYRSITERNLAYVTNTLQRWLARWKQEIESKLVNDPNTEVKFNTDALLESDPNTIADYSSKLQMQGIATINELRAMHNLDPVESGDKLPHEVALEVSQAQTTVDEESASSDNAGADDSDDKETKTEESK